MGLELSKNGKKYFNRFFCYTNVHFFEMFLIIVNQWKIITTACPCNNCHLFCLSSVMPNFAWRCFTASLLDIMFTNKIDCFTDQDGRQEDYF